MALEIVRKPDLGIAVADALGISREQAGEIVACVLEEIALGLAQDDQVQLLGFGSFVKRHRSAREGRNPRSGQAISIAAYETVIFRAGTKLKQVVNS